MYELQFKTFSVILLLQIDYNENEEHFFMSIMDAIEKNLLIEQSKIEVPVDIETNIEKEEVAVKHRALTSKRGKLNKKLSLINSLNSFRSGTICVNINWRHCCTLCDTGWSRT